MNTELKQVTVNFGGFYESYHGYQVENAIYPQDDGGDILYDEEPYTTFADASLRYCKDWVDLFNTEIGTNLIVEYLESPREYNFGTDKIIAAYSKEDFKAVFEYINANLLNDDVEVLYRKATTSYDGYSAFYSYSELFLSDNEGLRLQIMLDCIIEDLDKDYPFMVEGFCI